MCYSASPRLLHDYVIDGNGTRRAIISSGGNVLLEDLCDGGPIVLQVFHIGLDPMMDWLKFDCGSKSTASTFMSLSAA